MHNGKVQVRSLNTANQQVIQISLTHIAAQMACIGVPSQPIGIVPIHIIRSNANHNTRKSLCMGKVGSYCFSETLADTIHVHVAQWRFGMCLDIAWIPTEYLRTTGKDDHLADLILCHSYAVLLPLHIMS